MNVRILTFFLFLGIFPAYSQGGITAVRGNVIDKNTQKSLTEVYVAMPSTGYSSTTNEDGNFVFNYPAISHDSLVVFSAMGYANYTIKASKLAAENNQIELIPSEKPTALLGISDARNFVKVALDSIRGNFHTQPTYQNGFFCEMVMYDKIGVVKVNEALLKVERFPHPKNPTDKVKYLRGRKFDWKGQTSKMDGFGIENGASIVSRSIETSLPSYLEEKEMKNYEFNMDSLTTTFDNQLIYIVNFQPVNRRVVAARTGKIYIEPESKAIVRIEYEMTPEAARSVMNTGYSDIKIDGKSIVAYTQYRKFGKKWVLQDSKISFVAGFEDKAEHRFSVNATIVLRYLPSVSLPLVRSSISASEQLTSTQHFPKARFYTDEFWESNNYVIPTSELRKIEEHAR